MFAFRPTQALNTFADEYVNVFESLTRTLRELDFTSPAGRLAAENAVQLYLQHGANIPIEQTPNLCSIPYTPDVPDAPKCDVLLRVFGRWYAVER